MKIKFTLSMPNRGSWNGGWSGEKNLYAVIRSFAGKKGQAKAEAILAKRSFYYNFGDGWGASIRVSEADSAQARKARRNSRGFCGYEWMVDSIVADGVIYGPTRPKPVVTVSLEKDASPETIGAISKVAELVAQQTKPEDYLF